VRRPARPTLTRQLLRWQTVQTQPLRRSQLSTSRRAQVHPAVLLQRQQQMLPLQQPPLMTRGHPTPADCHWRRGSSCAAVLQRSALAMMSCVTCSNIGRTQLPMMALSHQAVCTLHRCVLTAVAVLLGDGKGPWADCHQHYVWVDNAGRHEGHQREQAHQGERTQLRFEQPTQDCGVTCGTRHSP
jgi:hypothetical protein